jgi:hypothetical protein
MGVPFPNLYDPERRRIKHEQQNAYSKIAELWAQAWSFRMGPIVWLSPGQKQRLRLADRVVRQPIRDRFILDLAQYLWSRDWHGGGVVPGFGSTYWAAHYQAARILGVTWLKLIIL